MLAAASLEHSPAKLEAGSEGFRDLQPDLRTLRSGVRGLLPRRFRTRAQVSAPRAQGYGMSASGIGGAPAKVRGLRLGADAPAMGLASALAMLPASPAALLRWSRGARSRLRRGDRRPWFIRQVMRRLSRRIRKQARRQGVSYSFLFMKASGDQLRALGYVIDAGAIRPVIDRTFPFASTNEAMAYVDKGRTKGKVVIRMA